MGEGGVEVDRQSRGGMSIVSGHQNSGEEPTSSDYQQQLGHEDYVTYIWKQEVVHVCVC